MKFRTSLLAALLMTGQVALAQQTAEVPAADIEQVRRAVGQLVSSDIESIKPSGIPSLYEVVVGAEIFYVTGDGRHLLHGDLYDVAHQKNITEETRSKGRIKALATVDPATMIVFGPEDAKYKVTVFTDIDCGYCRKLHKEIAEYNKLGIAIRYMAFPRSGKDTESYYKAVAAWCSADRKAALTASKAGQNLPKASADCKHPVDQHLKVARMVGVDGTPTILLDDGSVIPGYVPAERLLQAIKDSEKGS